MALGLAYGQKITSGNESQAILPCYGILTTNPYNFAH